MPNLLLSYIEKKSPVHGLTGAAKMVFFLLWSVGAMATYDTRLLAAMLAAGVCIFVVSKIKFREIWLVVVFITGMLLLNNVAIFLFSPFEGCGIYGARSDILRIAGRYVLTSEQLFYQANVTLKYFTVLPVALLFILTTDPGEFAASLNRIGVSYKIAFSVSLALRYIPDIQKSFQTVAMAGQARGVDISGKEKPLRRLKNVFAIIIPLIFSSLQRVETVANAMELRRFGTNRKRTWYNAKAFGYGDYAAAALGAVIVLAAAALFFVNGGRFYNPFA